LSVVNCNNSNNDNGSNSNNGSSGNTNDGRGRGKGRAEGCMKYEAVVFDLFGTLVDNFQGSPAEQAYLRMTDILGIDGDAFWPTWRSEPFATRRADGHYATFEDALRDVCRAAGVGYRAERVPEAIEFRLRVLGQSMVPRPDTVPTLTVLHDRGLKIGLVSDCTWEIPECWPQTPMARLVDAAVFSCSAGLKKPDPRIFALICEKLAVEPRQCLYVGDGGSDELAGARRAGMDAVLICVPYETSAVMSRPWARQWEGPWISSVSEVLELVSAEC
jgi:putative hydrolase of the HAD superfamily